MNTTHSQSTESQADQPLAGRRVLLAEDCMDQGRMFLHYLQKAGAEVVLECNGQAAVKTVKSTPDTFDAVVMDFEMPEMDGLFATLKLRDNGYQGAIIGITAYDCEELRESWFSAGCDAYLRKPLERAAFIETLDGHLRATVHDADRSTCRSCH